MLKQIINELKTLKGKMQDLIKGLANALSIKGFKTIILTFISI
jgi:hypothetical protein